MSTGGAAFPLVTPLGSVAPGMTLRDYFAAKAVLGLLIGNNLSASDLARFSYEVADEMIKAKGAA